VGGTAQRIRFGLFEFDLASRELRREGALVRLQSQPAQVLAALIARAGQLVTREELRAAVWDSATYVDFDRGLNFCIAQIRAALGDDSTEPRFIRTLPKRGYQFIAPVQKLEVNGGSTSAEPGASMRVRRYPASAAAIVIAAVLMLAIGLSAGYWLRARQISKRHPIVAVARFDNETGSATLANFADGLTDSVVEQLTSQGDGRFEVIGNARILRLPRAERDLSAIALSLNANYIVLGQVQSNGAQTRILVHLIRLPDQTHLWVARTDRSIDDPLAAQSEIAQKIADAFSRRIVRDSAGPPLPPLQNPAK
jgi:DNA-binding winged helix-turn-helix (wHTH) protein/TolB-like protein